MRTVSGVAVSSHLPAIYQLSNGHSRHPFSKSTFLICEHHVQFQINAFNKPLSCGVGEMNLNDAQQLFDDLSIRNDAYFSSPIASHSQCGSFFQTFTLVEGQELRFNGFVLANMIKGGSDVGGIGLLKQLHGWCICAGLGLETGIRTALITMYADLGVFDNAWQIFFETSISSTDDVSLWNSILAACVEHECYLEAFWLFGEMLSFGMVAPTEFTYGRILNSCASAPAEKYGMMVHGRIVKEGIIEAVHLWNALLTFYAKCGNIEDAMQLFERISKKDVVSWNTIIASCEQNGEEENAIKLFRRMIKIIQPNRITILSVLSAVSGLSALNLGIEIHAYVIKLGLESNTSLTNSLITMYSKCGKVGKARMVFEGLVCKDVITWNSMLAGYEQNKQCENCFSLFNKMLLSGVVPDSYTCTVILSAGCSEPSKLIHLKRAWTIHGYILKRTAYREPSLSVTNAILAMYAKFNQVEVAEKVFKGMRKRDSYSWNAMMDGYSSNAQFEEALLIFLDMLNEGFPLHHMSFSILLASCGRLALLQRGEQFHSIITKLFSDHNSACQDSFLTINTALVSMYSKCGSINNAAKVFYRMERRDVFSWTAMITGYAHHGMAQESLQLYEEMTKEGVKPNQVTFLGLLMACAHGGLVELGNHYFQSMTKDFGFYPSIEHYACMIDLFGRSGWFDHARSLVESGIFLFGPHHGAISNLWRVLLGACHAHKQLKLGVEAATRIIELEPQDEATHIILANLYASSGLWEDALRVREVMRQKELKKEVGCSWIDVGNTRHVFVSGDIVHPWRKEIYDKLSELNGRVRKIGYVPMTDFVLHDVDEMQKEEIVGCHSEKLAVSFGLLQSGTTNKSRIRVIKNLQTCGDCHNWMKFTSKMERRDIIVRDSRRFHHFNNGSCSCNDFW